MILQDKFLQENKELSLDEFVKLYVDTFEAQPSQYFIDKFLLGGSMAKKKTPSELVGEDRKVRKLAASEKVATKKYDELLKYVEQVERERDAIREIEEISTFDIKPREKSGGSESVAVVLASDFHLEELVDKNAVNGLNEYNLAIAEARATGFFRSVLRLIQIESADTRINQCILALLGDFISGNIHADIAENVALGPSEALRFAERVLASGIQFLLDNSKLNLVIPCHSGNHGRITKEQRFATENANSFEYYMYHALANHFKGEKRIEWLISPSYHSYVDVFGHVIRFHHGHAMKYGGGIGGLFVPTYRAIGNWNDGRRADLDCFGHFHQFRDGGSFICNGSLIGYNAYAVSIKAKFEKPKQTLFLIEKTRGRTCTWQISV